MKNILFSLLILALVSSCKDKNNKVSDSSETAFQLYYNGNILTMESEKPEYAEAVVTQDGKIVFVGSKEEAEENYAKANKIDLKGKTMLPGFIDPHSHFGMVSNTMGQVDLNPPPVGEVATIAGVLRKIETYKSEQNYPKVLKNETAPYLCKY